MQFALGALFATVLWWMATGIILYLDGLPARTHAASLAGATLLAALALAGVAACLDRQTVAGAYCAFACAIALWGWIELSFLTGFITGPRRTACARGCGGVAHAWHATEAVLYHELLILAVGVVLALVTRDRANPVALQTFAVLWVMRLSAKFNLFLGVRNLGEAFLPEHLAYLTSFLRRRSMNALFPVSMIAGAAGAALIGRAGLNAGATPCETTSAGLLSALLALAVVEHGFMMLPLSLDALWSWGFRSRSVPAVRPRV